MSTDSKSQQDRRRKGLVVSKEQQESMRLLGIDLDIPSDTSEGPSSPTPAPSPSVVGTPDQRASLAALGIIGQEEVTTPASTPPTPDDRSAFIVRPTGVSKLAIPVVPGLVDKTQEGVLGSTLGWLFPRVDNITQRREAAEAKLLSSPEQRSLVQEVAKGVKEGGSATSIPEAVAKGVREAATFSLAPRLQGFIAAMGMKEKEIAAGIPEQDRRPLSDYYDYFRDVAFEARDVRRSEYLVSSIASELLTSLLIPVGVVGKAGGSLVAKIASGAAAAGATNLGEVTAEIRPDNLDAVAAESRGALLLGGVLGLGSGLLSRRAAAAAEKGTPTVTPRETDVLAQQKYADSLTDKASLQESRQAGKSTRDPISGEEELPQAVQEGILDRATPSGITEEGKVASSLGRVRRLQTEATNFAEALDEVRARSPQYEDIMEGMTTHQDKLSIENITSMPEASIRSASSEALRRLGVSAVDELQESSPVLYNSLVKESIDKGRTVEQILAHRFYISEIKSFVANALPDEARSGGLTTSGASKILKEQLARGEGPAGLRDLYVQYNVLQDLSLAPLSVAAEARREVTSFSSVMRSLWDGRYVAIEADRLNKTGIAVVMDKLSAGINFWKDDLNTFGKGVEKVSKALRSTGVNADLPGINLVKKLELPLNERKIWLDSLAPEKRKAVEGILQLTQSQLTHARSLGVAIANFEEQTGRGYVHRILKDSSDLIISFREQRRLVEQKLLGGKTLDIGTIPELDSIIKEQWVKKETSGLGKEMDDLLLGLEKTSGVKINSAKIMLSQLGDVTSVSSRQPYQKLSMSARAAMERDLRDMPDFIREGDLSTIMSRWNQDTFRYARLRAGLAEMRAQVAILRTNGDNLGADYFTKLIGTLTSSRDTFASGLADMVTRTQTRLSVKASELRDQGRTTEAFITDMASSIPTWVSTSMQNLYPTYLGLRADVALRNLTQVALLTLPATVTPKARRYAAGLAVEAYNPLLRSRHPMSSTDSLRRRGLLVPQVTGAHYDAVRDGLLSSTSVRDQGSSALRRMNEAAMWLYTSTDGINRRATAAMAEQLGQDLLKGRPEALRILEATVESGYRDAIRAAIKVKDETRVIDLMQKQLIGRTQFNYDQASLSEFGRQFGPLFSMFSKWPTAVAADLWVTGVQEGKWLYTAQKYFAPLFLTLLAGYTISKGMEDMNMTETTEGEALRLLGLDARSFYRMSPVLAATDLVLSDRPVLGAPPVARLLAESARNVQKSLLTGDGDMTLGERLGSIGDAVAPVTDLIPLKVYYKTSLDLLESLGGVETGLPGSKSYKEKNK